MYVTIPDATECNSLKKVMDVVALCISVLTVLSVWCCCILNWTVLYTCTCTCSCYILLHYGTAHWVWMLFIIWVKKNPPPFPVQQDPCWMLHSQHAQCNKITCCTLLHKACYWWPFSKVDLYIQFYICTCMYNKIHSGSCCFWQATCTHSDKCCILLHSAWYPLIDLRKG